MDRRWQADLPKRQKTFSGASFAAAQAKASKSIQKASKMTPKRSQKEINMYQNYIERGDDFKQLVEAF